MKQLITQKQNHIEVINTNIYDKFALWIYKKTEDGYVVSIKECAQFIKFLKNGENVKDGEGVYKNQVNHFIHKARLYGEKFLKCTLENIQAVGWRKATNKETAFFIMRNRKRTILAVARTADLDELSKEPEISKHLPQAFISVFGAENPHIKRLAKDKPKYIEYFKKFNRNLENKKDGIQDETKN